MYKVTVDIPRTMGTSEEGCKINGNRKIEIAKTVEQL
jgi:hypothetical protein